jgi:hypothetical protein
LTQREGDDRAIEMKVASSFALENTDERLRGEPTANVGSRESLQISSC